MVTQVGIWSVGGPLPVRVQRSQLALEVDLEGWADAQPSILSEGLQVVARQLRVDAGRIDLLCIDAKARWVIVEFKRDRLYRETIVQAIDYAACVQTMDADVLRSAIASGMDRLANSDSVLESVDYQINSEDDKRDVAIIVTGTGVDPGLERVVRYLDRFRMPIRVVTFDVFEAPDGAQLLVREILDDEGSPTDIEAVKKSSRARTMDEIAADAEREGVGEAFRRIVAAAQGAGIYCRPYKRSVMLTPESHKNRYLMLLQPREDRGLLTHYGSDAFAEFFPGVIAREVEDALGFPTTETTFLTRENWEEKTQVIVAFLEQLPAPESSEDGPRADAETVIGIAALIEAGEWTTYGDLSIAAIGRSSAAMAIGQMARSMDDFPNPHRILNLRGQIPSGWRSDDGQGPEECRRRLDAEGINFDETGTASAAARLPLDRLVERASALT